MSIYLGNIFWYVIEYIQILYKISSEFIYIMQYIRQKATEL